MSPFFTSMPRLLIVADDLTGACDAAVAFAQRGSRTRVWLDGALRPPDTLDVCAISTGSRDISAAESSQRLAAVASLPSFTAFPILFKKIDSVFRGNTVHEIAASVRHFGRRLVVIAPSYPALGRTSHNGVVRVRDLHGERAIPVLDMLRSAGLNPLHIPAGKAAEAMAAHLPELERQHDLRHQKGRVLYVDATEQAHLEAATLAAHHPSPIDPHSKIPDILWIGSGGLAHALAASHAPAATHTATPQPQEPAGSILIFAGSDHPVTGRQLDHLLSGAGRAKVALYPPNDDHPAQPNPTPPTQPAAILMRIACGQTSPQQILSLTQRIDPAHVSCLFLTGGDTAALVARALGITAIDLQLEFAPGLAQGLAVGGRFAGRTVVLKSGGFGDADAITRVVQHFAQPGQAPASTPPPADSRAGASS